MKVLSRHDDATTFYFFNKLKWCIIRIKHTIYIEGSINLDIMLKFVKIRWTVGIYGICFIEMVMDILPQQSL